MPAAAVAPCIFPAIGSFVLFVVGCYVSSDRSRPLQPPAPRAICHVSRGFLLSVEVHSTPLDSHRNWQPLAQQIPRKATHHNNRCERVKERWCLYQDKEGDSPSVMKCTQIAVARSSECGRGISNGAVNRRSYRHDTLALPGR